jgi:hypothetical protein
MPRLFPAACATLVAALALSPASASADWHHHWWPGDDGSQTSVPDPSQVPDPTAPAPTDPAADPQPGDGTDLPPQLPGVPAVPTTPAVPLVPIPTTATIPGIRALMRADGKAAIPRGAPLRVQRVIAAANRIIGKPYKWGGGHASLVDKGYDCSGAVSYSLIRSSLLDRTMVSGELAHWGATGTGRWITVYATRNHVYMEVAGLRFDTSPVGDPTGRMGVRWRPAIGRRPGFHVRHPAGL